MRKKKRKVVEPVKKLKVPKELKQYGNGRIPADQLIEIRGGGTMWGQAGFWWWHLCEEASKAGIEIRCVSEGYRSLARQEALFLMRYSDKPTTRKPEVTRRWRGKKYWLRSGKAPVATPGSSNHGWGMAQDIEVPAKTYKWMCENAPRFGFYLQGKSKLLGGRPNPEFEPWHWQFCHAE